MPIQLHNYDVLLLPSVDDDEQLRFAPGNHVGNQRFRVLLSLFRQRYLQAGMFGDEYECNSIAQEVLATVCTKCVPNGRFFEQGRDNKWEQFDSISSSTVGMIRNALRKDPIEGSHEMERSRKRLCRSSSSGFELLYKAASKELPSPVPQEQFVESPNPFDVVCEANGLGTCLSKDRKHTGNNRLKIMFQLRMTSYKASTQEGKPKIAEEVVSSIVDDASGQFLQVDKPSGMYKVLPRSSATACIKNELQRRSKQEFANKKKFRESEVKKLVQRKHKKAILDRLEKRKGGRINSFSSSALPTRFNNTLRHTVGSRAA